jgi:hypothetical protein
MWKHLFSGFNWIHATLLFLAAAASFRFLVRIRFWFPKYIHVLAAIGLAISIWALSAMPADAPANKDGPVVRLLIALALPAIIYVFFIVYGGPRAAFYSSFRDSAPCPFCKCPVRTLPDDIDSPKASPQFAEKMCPACDRELT